MPIRPGAVVPGVGTVASVRSMIGLWDRIAGKHHKDTALYLVTTTAGERLKLVVTVPESAAAKKPPRTERAAERLRALEPADCVPRVRYVDARRLLLEFVPGSTLAAVPLTAERTANLARFVAIGQTPLEPGGLGMPRFTKLIEKLQAGGFLSAVDLPAALAAARRITALSDAPRALCFSDSALKNYVEEASGRLKYIDAFGIMPRVVGAVLVRQVMSLPPSARPQFLEAYLAASPHAGHLRAHLPEYCLHHLIERAAAHIPQPQTAHHRTRRRNRQRRRVLEQTVARLHEALALPRDPETFRRWLEQTGE